MGWDIVEHLLITLVAKDHLDPFLTLWILWSLDLMMVFPYSMDPMMVPLPYDGLPLPYSYIPYQWPALLSSPPALLSCSFGLCPPDKTICSCLYTPSTHIHNTSM